MPCARMFVVFASTRLFLSATRTRSTVASINHARNARTLKLAPAGVTDIRAYADPSRNLFYVDKSPFVRLVEEASEVVVLLRPQRWGKTTFSNLLCEYYDVARAEKPLVRILSGNTLLACSFCILRFDLANVSRALTSTVVGAEAVKAALDAEVRSAVKMCILRYNVSGVDVNEPVLDVLRALGHWAGCRGTPLYIVVDEYDALLRSLQIVSGSHVVASLAGREGPLREFFGRIKSLHDSGNVPRVFLTGSWKDSTRARKMQ
jgi:hypothetical protein